ncbi:calcium-binding protein [Thalassospira sp. SN3W]|uniref:calcium-binding protein n=1 Tax=Thalassospira sp. SN3W TaxID=3035476 RepID=UPI00311B3042
MVELIYGTDGADVLVGTEQDDHIFGRAGSDDIRGLGGNDRFYEIGPGNDTLDGGAGHDHFHASIGDDTLLGGSGNDKLDGGPGADVIDGGPGRDEIRFSYSNDSAKEGVIVNLATGIGVGGDADGDRYFNIEDIRDSRYGDILIGDDGNNAFFQTGAGDGDVMNGGGGDDTFYAAYGSAFSEEQTSIFIGGEGSDTISYIAGWGNDAPYGEYGPQPVINLETGSGRTGDHFISIENVDGSNQSDLIIGDENDNHLIGNKGGDTIYGRDGDDVIVGENIHGEAGNDTLTGEWYDVSLYGGDGHDTLDAGPIAHEAFSDNILSGGGGNDWLQGNIGDDTFVFDAEASSRDRVVDFESGNDGDTLLLTADLQARSGITDFNSLLDHATETDGGDLYIDFSNGAPWTFGVIIEDITKDDLTPDNVEFG